MCLLLLDQITFADKVSVYGCKYTDEDKLQKKITTFLGDIRHHDDSNLACLLLWNSVTNRIKLFIGNDPSKIITLREVICGNFIDNLTDNIQKMPDIDPVNYLLLIQMSVDPIQATYVLNIMKKILGKNNELFRQSDIQRIIIPKETKAALRKQLMLMGMNLRHIYPEPSHFFDGLKEQYE